MMSLTGNLDVFPLPEVLRLLARSQKTGRLAVDAPETSGRVYMEDGALVLATVVDDAELLRQLRAAGIVDDDGVRRIEVGEQRLDTALAAGTSGASLTDFVREHVVESLYRIGISGATFVFHVDEGPRYHPSQRFDVEVAMADAERRRLEWAEIESVLPGVQVPVRMVRHLADESDVTVSPGSWEVLAMLDGGSSVEQLADRLGLSAFRVAREVAGLLRRGLLEVVGQDVPAASPDTTWESPLAAPRVEEPETPEPAAPAWGAPEVEAPAADIPSEATPEEAAAPAAEAESERSAESWWSEPSDDRPAEEGDRFLESVFSQLDEEEADDEGGFAMGALRRRLGALQSDQDDARG
jgi:hypothetical protein